MKNNFLQRAITGILFVAIIVGCILYDPLAFGTLFVIVSALTIREFGHLVNQSGEVSINRTITMLGGAYLFLAIMGFCIDAAGSKIFIPYLILIIYLMVSELYLKKKNPVLNWAYSMLSQMYIALPFALVTSGTATLETALFRVPQVVCYHTPVGKLVSFLRRHILKVKFISLVNLIAGREVVRELVADTMTVENMRAELECLLFREDYRRKMLDGYEEMARLLGPAGAPRHAACEMVKLLKK